jgi:methionyl-tRNA formyltransferase
VVRIVFFGTPEFAVPSLQAILQSGRHEVAAVITQPDRPRGRRQRVQQTPVKRAALAWAPVLQPERIRTAGFLADLESFRPDLGVVAAYGKLIPDEVLNLPRHGMINVHASLLPKYRGAAPIHRAVIDGEPETGVTIMRVEKMLDAGPMLATVKRPIGPDETSDIIELDLARLGASLLVDVVDQLAAGTTHEELQDFMLCSYAPKLTKDEGLIDWTLPASYVHNRVRGLYPWPHAYTFLDGMRIIVLKTRVEDAPTDAAPGTVIDVERDAIHVATGHQGRIALERVQLEGGRPLTVREFLAGHPVRVGQQLA